MNRKLKFESLEAKKLLAADVGLSEVGELLIQGSDGPDIVIVTAHKSTLKVTIDHEVSAFSTKDVHTLRFLGGDGDDFFVNKTDIPVVGYGNRGNDILVGGPADDRLHGGPGDDRLVGSDGNDSLHGDWGDDRLEGGRGKDDLRGWYGDDVLKGGDDDDYLSGYKGNDKIWGGKGNDMIKGHEGNDQLFGEAGNDRLYGWRGNDLLHGGSGNDALSGWSGNDILVGGSGNDLLRGHSGNDLIIGGRDADRIQAGSGEDFVISGYTKYDNRFDKLDEIMQTWNASNDTHQRLEELQPFMHVSVLKYKDNAIDQIYDDRSELDLFVLDRYDVFIEL